MLRKDIAAELGISPSMVTRLAKRGMPTSDANSARRWRDRHLDPARVKGLRMQPQRPAPHDQGARTGAVQHGEAQCLLSDPPLGEEHLFVAAALFTAAHGIERFGPLLVHLSTHMSDAAYARLGLPDDPDSLAAEVPQTIWGDGDAWEKMDAEYYANYAGKCDEPPRD